MGKYLLAEDTFYAGKKHTEITRWIDLRAMKCAVLIDSSNKNHSQTVQSQWTFHWNKNLHQLNALVFFSSLYLLNSCLKRIFIWILHERNNMRLIILLEKRELYSFSFIILYLLDLTHLPFNNLRWFTHTHTPHTSTEWNWILKASNCCEQKKRKNKMNRNVNWTTSDGQACEKLNYHLCKWRKIEFSICRMFRYLCEQWRLLVHFAIASSMFGTLDTFHALSNP